MRPHRLWFAVFAVLVETNLSAAVLYVDVNSTTPVAPYTNWSTAANVIQDAVDAASSGDQVLVTNGIYHVGGRIVHGALTNRVVIDKPLVLQSVNGPIVTLIEGFPTNDTTAVRCVYLTNSALLVGFTLHNGGTLNTGDTNLEQSGGGAWCETTNDSIVNCIFSTNIAQQYGGAVYSGTLNGCVLTGNSSGSAGGGAYLSVLNGCSVSNNIVSASGTGLGGGVYGCTLTNCTLFGNNASYGGGAYGGSLDGCTLIENSASYGGAVYGLSELPVLVKNSELSRNAAGHGGGTCGETTNSCVLSNVLIKANHAFFQGGGATLSILSGCDIVSNVCPASGGGAYACYVSNSTVLGNVAGYGGGAHSSVLNGCLVVSNTASDTISRGGDGRGGGVHSSSATNCEISGNLAVIYGGGAEQSNLEHCKINQNSAFYGGGVDGLPTNLINNCELIGNSASHIGGAADNCTLANYLVLSNSAFWWAGGAISCSLMNCTVVGNSTSTASQAYGGGVLGCAVSNSVVMLNFAPSWPNWGPAATYSWGDCRFIYSCTSPSATNGFGNINLDPLFVNSALGDFHLQSNSPCINAGNNAFVTNITDFDGNPRIAGGTVDIGAYEFQHPTSLISYAWLEQYGLPIDGSADFTDPDQDGMNNWQEWMAGTDPTNTASVLRMLAPSNSTNGVEVSWLSAPNKNYILTRSSNFGTQPAFQTLATNIPGQTNTTTFIDTNALGPGAFFYRVGIMENP